MNWRVDLPLLAMPAVLTAYALAPGPGRAIIYLLVDLTCISGVLLAQRHRPRAQSAMWFVAAMSMSLATVGDAALFLPILLHGHSDTVPPLTDGAYLASYVVCGIAMAMFVRRTGNATRGDVLDASVFTVGFLAVAWPLLNSSSPLSQGDGTPTAAVSLLASMLVLSVGLLAATTGAWRVPAVRGLICACAIGFVATAVLGAAIAAGVYTPGSIFDAGWLLAYLLTLRTALVEHRHPILSTMAGDALRDTALVTDRASALQPPSTAAPRDHVGPGFRVIGSSRIIALTASLAAAPLYDAFLGYPREDDILFLLLTAIASCLVGFRIAGLMNHIRGQATQMRTRALHDDLTGLPNREHLRGACITALQSARDRALVFIDLDDFKTVNDTRGHAVGDQLLLAVAHRLTAASRHGDLVARLGGDEFAILIAAVPDDAQAAAERFTCALSAEPVDLDGQRYTIKASAGVTLLLPDAGTDPEETYQEALAEADIAMYAAKRSGGGRGLRFEPTQRDDLLGSGQLAEDLRAALADDALDVAYQPVVFTVDGTAVALEALVRWHHPVRGDVPAGTFLPLALERGLTSEIDLLVLPQALAAVATCRALPGCEDLSVHVNLSSAALNRHDLVELVTGHLDTYQVPGSALVIEITEQTLVERRDSVAAHLSALQEIGVRVALDDFGTGYSSLSYLDAFDVDTLRLDRGLVSGGATADGPTPLLQAVLQLAATLDITVVADGVETSEQHDALLDLSCPLSQGSFHAPPLGLTEALAWLVRTNAPTTAQGRGSVALQASTT
jgi:diguanylate cyclase (GGDEF)-like protein